MEVEDPGMFYAVGFVSTICVPSEGKQHEFKNVNMAFNI